MADTSGVPKSIKGIMNRLGRGPNASNSLGRELQANPPVWDTIQTKTQKYTQLAAAMGQYQPERGTKESWDKFTAEFVAAASALDRAAQAKDKNAALAAHTQFQNSCNQCHREHRQMRRGMGMPGA
jgi:hypothetical protein